jgi:putative transcriptional regulator
MNRLRDERDRLGLTQAALAERAGVSRKTINTIENLVFEPSALLAIKLAQIMDRKVEDIFWIDGD